MKPFEPVKVEPCKNCGSTLKQYNPNSDVIICDHCGTSTTDENTAKTTSDKAYQVPENPLLKLHETFEYDSATWQIIGCICYQGNVREWDSEDDVWETNPWKYNSWWVMNEAREIAWIVHDSTGYKWSSKTTLTSRIPENDRSYEKGSWEIVSAVGEFSYFPTIGGTSTTYERGTSSIEILLDSQGNKKEVEAFINTPIKPLDLFEAFNKTELLADLKRGKLARKIIFASALCLLVGYFLLTLRSETLLNVSTETTRSTWPFKLIPLGEISLDKKSLLQFSFKASLPRGNGNFDADLIIEDAENRVVSALPVNFWRVSGRDSDGPWVETTKSVSSSLNLPQNKKYRLTLKPSDLKQWKSISIKGSIKKNTASPFPMYVGILLLGLLLLLQYVSQRNFIRKHTGMKV